MQKYLYTLIVTLLTVSASMAQQRYLTEDILDDTERIAEEIVTRIYDNEPETYLESISLVGFEEVEQDYFVVYNEMSDVILKGEDSYEVNLIVEEGIQTRYYNSMGSAFLTVYELNEEDFPKQIIEEILEVTPSHKIEKFYRIEKAPSINFESVYKVRLASEEGTKDVYYKEKDGEFVEARVKSVSMLQK